MKASMSSWEMVADWIAIHLGFTGVSDRLSVQSSRRAWAVRFREFSEQAGDEHAQIGQGGRERAVE
jgi:hypothetical protein